MLYYMARSGMMSLDHMGTALMDTKNILPAALLAAFDIYLGIVRWQCMLKNKKIFISYRETSELMLIGNFFNNTVPGAVAGDVLKTLYLTKDNADNASSTSGPSGSTQLSASTIFFDRFVTLASLAIVSGCALSIAHFQGEKSDFVRLLFIPAIGFFSLFSLLTYYLFFVTERSDLFLKIFRVLEKKMRCVKDFREFYEHLKEYSQSKKFVFQMLFLSTVMTSINVVCYIFFAQALGETSFSILGLFVIVPMVYLICAIPLAPAGLGSGNLAMLALGKHIGLEKGADLFAISAFITILLSLLGGVFYLKRQQHLARPQIKCAL